MASTIQKLLRKSPPTRLFSARSRQSEPNLFVPFNLQQPHQNGITKPDPHLGRFSNPNPFLSPEDTENLSHSSPIYPSFPFGFCLNLVPLSGSVPSEAEDVVVVVEEDSRKVWADSTKKKRKKKMNKHKYQKLRKRLRRQT